MSKRKIEDVINESFVFVEGEQKLEERANALDFIAHLRASNAEIPLEEAGNLSWPVKYKGEELCLLLI